MEFLMTNCVADVCGTGTWTGPLPGDPDVNNSVLSATAAFGGIEVSWLYPGLNPQAVAHTLLYRAVSNDFTSAILRAVVAGNTFYDRIDSNLQYFYWVKIVSVNGTVGNLIGPAHATARPLIDDLIAQLSGKINDSLLAQALKTSIDKITLNYGELQTEILGRLNSENVLSLALAEAQGDAAQTLAFVSQEITTRANGDSALATQVNTIAALNSSNAAAILTEKTARVTADSALATSVTSVLTATNNNAAAIITETTARTNADSALSNQITTAQSTLNGSIASVQTGLQTNINTIDGKVTAVGALYTVKLQANGLAGGFAVFNDGTEVVAGFDVNKFWVGSSTGIRKPFIVVGSETFIDQAVINKLTFSKLTDEAGTFVVENGKVKANYLDTNGMIIRDAAGIPMFGAGVPLGWDSVVNKPTFGGLAYQNHATLGSTVRFPDGTLLGTYSFVNTLSKIGSGNIGNFMDGAAITNAYIGNAAVETLSIAGNAVTVPQFAEAYPSSNHANGASDLVCQTNSTFINSNGGSAFFLATVTVTVYCSIPSGIQLKVYLVQNGQLVFSRSSNFSAGASITYTGGISIPYDGNWSVAAYIGGASGQTIRLDNIFITVLCGKR